MGGVRCDQRFFTPLLREAGGRGHDGPPVPARQGGRDRRRRRGQRPDSRKLADRSSAREWGRRAVAGPDALPAANLGATGVRAAAAPRGPQGGRKYRGASVLGGGVRVRNFLGTFSEPSRNLLPVGDPVLGPRPLRYGRRGACVLAGARPHSLIRLTGRLCSHKACASARAGTAASIARTSPRKRTGTRAD